MTDTRLLVRIGGYLLAGGLLAAGVGAGGTAGTVLIVGGLVLVAALLLTFRLR